MTKMSGCSWANFTASSAMSSELKMMSFAPFATRLSPSWETVVPGLSAELALSM